MARSKLDFDPALLDADVGGMLLGTMKAGLAIAGDDRPDFLEWLSEHGWLIDAHAEPSEAVIPFRAWPQQEELARFLISGYASGQNRTVNKSRKIGATWMACHAIEYLFEYVYRFSSLLVSRKDELVDDGTEESLFGKIRFIQSMHGSDTRPTVQDNTKRIRNLSNHALLKGETTNVALGRSTRYAVVLTDEWAFVEIAKQKKIKLSLQSVGRSWWRISTPNDKGDDFHKQVIVGRKRNALRPDAPIEERTLLEIGWRADPSRTQKWYDGLLAETVIDDDGEAHELTWDEREREYNLSFRGVSGTRIFKVPDEERLIYDDSDLPKAARKNWMWCAMMDFGSGPSWSVFLLAMLDYRNPKRVEWWFDTELIFEKVEAGEQAKQIRARVKPRYSSRCYIGGDPAGKAAESDQKSWQKRLRTGGVPIRVLPSKFNERAMIDMTLIEAQKMMDQPSAHLPGKSRVHIHRDLVVLLETLDSWEWNIPAGVDPHIVSRALISPKKNCWSHAGDTFRMNIGAVLRLSLKASAGKLRERLNRVPSAPSEISDVYARVLSSSMPQHGPSLLGGVDDNED